jgi:hypothetical protein
MRPNDYKVLCMAIEEGIAYGYTRAFKHTDTPSEEVIKIAMEESVLSSICEWFDFREGGTDED